MAWPAWMVFVDAKGNKKRLTWWQFDEDLPTSRASAYVLAGFIAGLSNANWQNGGGLIHTDNLPLQRGVNAVYPSVEDNLVLIFEDTTGQFHKYEIPAPKEEIFLADGETLDTTNTDVLGVYSYARAHGICGRAGNTMVDFTGGYRVRKRMQRRITLYTSNPALDGPA